MDHAYATSPVGLSTLQTTSRSYGEKKPRFPPKAVPPKEVLYTSMCILEDY